MQKRRLLTAPFRKVIATRRINQRLVAEEEELAWYHRLIIIKRIIKIEIFQIEPRVTCDLGGNPKFGVNHRI